MKGINVTIPLNDLAAAIADQLLPVLRSLNQPSQPALLQEDYLTRKETADLLNVSLPTLTQYTKFGRIIGYRFGTRVLYKQSEIANALQKIKGGDHE